MAIEKINSRKMFKNYALNLHGKGDQVKTLDINEERKNLKVYFSPSLQQKDEHSLM